LLLLPQRASASPAHNSFPSPPAPRDRDRDRAWLFTSDISIPMAMPMPIPTRATKGCLAGSSPVGTTPHLVGILRVAFPSVSGSQSGSGSSPSLHPRPFDADAAPFEPGVSSRCARLEVPSR
jgi:hypothetical protein